MGFIAFVLEDEHVPGGVDGHPERAEQFLAVGRDHADLELGTKGLSETVNAALRHAARRRTLKRFDVLLEVDGTPQEVAAGRELR